MVDAFAWTGALMGAVAGSVEDDALLRATDANGDDIHRHALRGRLVSALAPSPMPNIRASIRRRAGEAAGVCAV